jgi:hypothetical protein
MKGKTTWALFGTLLIFISLPILYYMLLLGGFLYPNPPKPDITYGEFPFKLTYKLNGETKIIEDVIVCEYDGIESRGEAGKYRKWTITIKGNSEWMPNSDGELILLDTSNKEISNSQGDKVLEIHFFVGDAGYYMGDEDALYVAEAQQLNRVYYLYAIKDGSIRYGTFSADEAYEKVGIKLISWEGSDRIENTFPGQN